MTFLLAITDFSTGEGVYTADMVASLAPRLGYDCIAGWDRGLHGWPKLRRATLVVGLTPVLSCRFTWRGMEFGAFPYTNRGYAELCRLITDQAHPPGCMIATAVLACAEENGPVADHLASLRRHASAAFVARIDADVASGELPAGTSSQTVARFYGSIIQGMSVQATDGADGPALRLIADMAMDAWDDVVARSCGA